MIISILSGSSNSGMSHDHCYPITARSLGYNPSLAYLKESSALLTGKSIGVINEWTLYEDGPMMRIGVVVLFFRVSGVVGLNLGAYAHGPRG
eukprot:scaffold212553_cov35-Attheya_sp.AAC.3